MNINAMREDLSKRKRLYEEENENGKAHLSLVPEEIEDWRRENEIKWKIEIP